MSTIMQNQMIIEKIFKQKVCNIQKNILDNDKDSITNKVSFGKPSIYKYNIQLKNGTKKSFVGKWKSKKIIINGIKLISGNDMKMAIMLAKNHKVFGFNQSHLREMIFYKNVDTPLNKYLIKTLGYYRNKITDTYFIAMNYVSDSKKITAGDLTKIIDGITDFHKIYYNSPTAINKLCLNHYERKDYRRAKKVLSVMFDKLDDSNQKIFGLDKTFKIKIFIQNIENEYQKVLFHQTLTHNDFSPRNIFLKDEKICFYDWELACYQNPEHDLIELLVSVMHELNDSEIKMLIEYFKEVLLRKLDINIDDKQYFKIIKFNVLEYTVNRLTLLRMADKKLKLKFISQMTWNISRLMDILDI